MSKPRKSKAAPPAVTAQPASELILYQTDDNQTRIEVRLEGETVWLTQKLMSELFQKDVRTINEHIQNIFEEGELSPESVIRKFRITAADGKSYETQHYNLNVIISVGYRVKSYRGTQFRIWATQRLREYIVKGFTMDDERLKRRGGGQYVEELLARRRHPASRCNELVATLSDEVFIAPATASGQISKLKQRLETWGVKPIHAVE